MQISGLAERKERRRAKRAVLKPASNVVTRDAVDVAVGHQSATPTKPSSSRREKSKAKVNKLSAGLALMHGFSAQNVGASRLTVSESQQHSVIATSDR